MKTRFTFRHCAEYAGLRMVQCVLTIIPIPWTGVLLSGILHLVFCVAWPLRKETVSRIREVFGADTSMEVCRRIARISVWNMLMNFVEMFHASRMDMAYLKSHLIGTEEARAQLRSLIDKYGGVVIALPHMGNWDLAGVACSIFGFPLMAIGRPQNNPLFEAWLRRSRLNFQTVDKRSANSFIRIVHHLKGGGVFAILPDVRHNKPGVSTTVFGKPGVQLGKGVSKFARMANVPIVPIVMERLDASHHQLYVGSPILPNLDVAATEDAVRVTQQIWNMFEHYIRAKPEQWFWHNRRWILTPLYTQTR